MNAVATRFSVVISLYNKEAFVHRALSSVLEQSYSQFEVIVVDDGSTDESATVARELAKRDGRVRIITQANAGPGAARNRGVEASQFPWVAFLDADDAWRVDHLAELSETIRTFDDARIVTTRLQEAHTATSRHERVLSGRSEPRRRVVDYFHEAALRPDFIHSSSVAIAREVFTQVGGFRAYSRGEDQEFWARVCLECVCAASDAATAYYYRGTGGIMEKAWQANRMVELRPPESLADLTRAVAFLAAQLDSDSIASTQSAIRSSVIEYINSRVTIALRVHLYNGDVRNVASIANLYLQPFDRRTRYWRTVARKTPLPLLRGFYRGRQLLKLGYHSSRRTVAHIRRTGQY